MLTSLSTDPTTVRNCLSGKAHFKSRSTWDSIPVEYRRRNHRWFASASLSRWLITTVACVTTLGAATGLLVYGINDIRGNTLNDALSLGFGAINTAASISAPLPSIVATVLVANSAQLLLSFLYFAYNSLWTCMLLTEEWASYARRRNPLRVTSPIKGQRSTYRLQLPYRYGIPLMVLSGVLHWFVSQSIFLIVLEAYDDNGYRDENDDISTCGYSPVAILTTIITGALVLALGIANGCRRYKMNGMPLAGSCSAAISAACHPPPGDDKPSGKALMWGACRGDGAADWVKSLDLVDRHYSGEEGATALTNDAAIVGHCSFTSFAVERPVEGGLYAGRLPNSKE